MTNKHLLCFALFVTLVFNFLLPSHSLATSWAYPFVVWDGYMYEVTDEHVTEIDSEIGKVTKYSDMDTYSGNFSNHYRKGTKYFSIKDTNTDEAIAVQLEKGKYKKAVRKGVYDGGRNEVSSFTSIDLVIIVAVGLMITLIAALVITFVYHKDKK